MSDGGTEEQTAADSPRRSDPGLTHPAAGDRSVYHDQRSVQVAQAQVSRMHLHLHSCMNRRFYPN